MSHVIRDFVVGTLARGCPGDLSPLRARPGVRDALRYDDIRRSTRVRALIVVTTRFLERADGVDARGGESNLLVLVGIRAPKHASLPLTVFDPTLASLRLHSSLGFADVHARSRVVVVGGRRLVLVLAQRRLKRVVPLERHVLIHFREPHRVIVFIIGPVFILIVILRVLVLARVRPRPSLDRRLGVRRGGVRVLSRPEHRLVRPSVSRVVKDGRKLENLTSLRRRARHPVRESTPPSRPRRASQRVLGVHRRHRHPAGPVSPRRHHHRPHRHHRLALTTFFLPSSLLLTRRLVVFILQIFVLVVIVPVVVLLLLVVVILFRVVIIVIVAIARPRVVGVDDARLRHPARRGRASPRARSRAFFHHILHPRVLVRVVILVVVVASSLARLLGFLVDVVVIILVVLIRVSRHDSPPRVRARARSSDRSRDDE